MSQTEISVPVNFAAALQAARDHLTYKSSSGVEFLQQFNNLLQQVDETVLYLTSDTFKHLDTPSSPLVEQTPCSKFNHLNNFYLCFYAFSYRFSTFHKYPEFAPEFMIRFVRQYPELYKQLSLKITMLMCVYDLLDSDQYLANEIGKEIDIHLYFAYPLMANLIYEEDHAAKKESDGSLDRRALIR
jgi:hypothetical protein